MRLNLLSFCRVIVVCVISLTSLQAFSAPPVPDAGTILREQPKPPAQAPSATPQIEVPTPGAQETDNGAKILVNSFAFQGALLVSKDDLSALLKPYVGKELSFRQLQLLTPLVALYYIQHGYIARVILPPQEIKDGVVTFQIIEGKRGDLSMNSEGDRINSDWAKRMIEYRLPSKAPMNIAALGEAMNILNEQPGIAAKVALVPGKTEGDIDLNVTSQATPLITGSLSANSNGYRATGIAQAQGAITLNNPTGHFDAATLLANVSQGTNYLRGDYSIAVGDSGLRLGVNASYLDYEIVQPSLKASGAHGTAKTVGLAAIYPFARRTDFNLSLTGSYDYQAFQDLTNAGETGNRRVPIASIGLNGYVIPSTGRLLSGGVTSFAANISHGDSTEHNLSALNADSTTRRVEGGFAKLNFSLGHLRPMAKDWNLDANLRGQITDKNVDSAARFNLGGANGVRAYPVGEATGDEGWVLNLNVRHPINDRLNTSVFFDAGGVRLNHNTWANWNSGNPRLENSYQLYGAGVAADWRVTSNTLFNATLATPIGSNAGRDSNGKNADGYSNRLHLWLNLKSDF